ncbi:hypothetical protein MBLNU457_g2485t1 [Dothideomycetes sp. NU457]
MWLDRFSGHSTPSASPVPWNRSNAPVPPRRSSQFNQNALPPKRPGLPQRVTSWSGLTNGSTDSLPASARVPNASTLRDQLVVPQTNGSDPLDALQDILRTTISRESGAQDEGSQLTDGDLVEDIDFGGLSLQAFADSEPAHIPGGTTRETSFADGEAETKKLEELHKSIAACDQVLISVEKNLTSFQADLALVSAEIETLQTRSTNLDSKLQNRKNVEKLLGPELDGLGLSPAAARKIQEGNMDDAWVKALDDLEKRSKVLEIKAKTGDGIKAIDDLRPLFDNLKDRAVERIRDYVVAQIKALRGPNVNAQVLQHSALARYKDAYAFLAKHQPKLEEEISQAYVNTMRWYYLSNFTRYKTSLDKLNLQHLDKTDTIGQDDSSKRAPASRPGAGPRDPFSLGQRINFIRSPNTHALSTYVIEEDKSAHFLEMPFRTFNLALIDNASAEFSFLTEFFSNSSFHVVSRRFNDIFQPTLELAQSLTKQLVDSTSDALGILMCVRLNQHFAFELQRRKVSSMEGYVNATSMLLWPKFQMVMDMHCESLRKAAAALPGRPAGSALSLTSSSNDGQSVAPHPTTQRFANFVQSTLQLSTEAGDDEPVQRSLGRLRDDFQTFLVKLSKSIAEVKKRERFLFNNYSLIGTIINDNEGKMADDFKGYFTDLRVNLAGR